MTTEETLGSKISKHFSASLPQEPRIKGVGTGDVKITVYDVVKSCFKQITLFRKVEKDWAVAATHLMGSFEAAAGYKISISPCTLRIYYYAIKAEAGSKKKKASKSKKKGGGDLAEPLPVAEPVDVVEAEIIEPGSATGISKETATPPHKGRRRAETKEGGFQVPRRPGFIPPVHL